MSPFMEALEAHRFQNLVLREMLLPERCVAEVQVSLVEARDLVPKSWMSATSNPFVSLALVSASEAQKHGLRQWAHAEHGPGAKLEGASSTKIDTSWLRPNATRDSPNAHRTRVVRSSLDVSMLIRAPLPPI